MQDLIQKRNELEDILVSELETLKRSGIQNAENKAAYRAEVSKETLRLRSEGYPVSITSDVVRGLPHIAALKQAWDASEAVYNASKEAINVYKLRLRVVQDDITYERQIGRYDDVY